MAKSSVLSLWEELFGESASPSSSPNEVTGFNQDTDSTVRLVNASKNPLRGRSVFDDGWTESKPMPLRASEGEDGTITAGEGDIALLWKITSGVVGLGGVVGPELKNTWDYDWAKPGPSNVHARSFEIAETYSTGDRKTVRGKFRYGAATQISDWQEYNAGAMRDSEAADKLSNYI